MRAIDKDYNKLVYYLLIIFLMLFVFNFPRYLYPAETSRKTPVVSVVERVSPAVVNISTERVIKETNPFYNFGGNFLTIFFGIFLILLLNGGIKNKV